MNKQRKHFVIRFRRNLLSFRPVIFFAFLAVVCLPFSTITIGGVGLLMIIGLPLLFLSIPSFLRRLKETRWDKATLLLAAFFLYNLVGYFHTPSFSAYSLYNYVKIILIVMCFYVQSYRDGEKLFLLSGSVISCLIVCWFILTGTNIGFVSGRPTIAVFGVAQDPNYIGYLFLISMAVSIRYFMDSKKVLGKLIWGVFSAVVLFCVLMTGSRGALLGLVAVGFTSVVLRFRSFSSKLLFSTAMFILVIVVYEYIVQLLPEAIAARFSLQELLDSGGTGRMDIWIRAFEVLASKPYKLIFGFGTGSSHALLDGWAAHNLLIQLLLERGVVGTWLFLYFLWIWVRRLFVRDSMCLSILMGCMAMAMTLSVNTIYYFWFVFILGIVCSKDKIAYTGGSIET